jgi:hypothetical protein
MYFHYKIFIHEKCLQNENDKFQKILSRPSIIDAKAHYWAAGRRLRSPDLDCYKTFRMICNQALHYVCSSDVIRNINIGYGPIPNIFPYIRWVPCHHGMARSEVVDGGDALHIWRVANSRQRVVV